MVLQSTEQNSIFVAQKKKPQEKNKVLGNRVIMVFHRDSTAKSTLGHRAVGGEKVTESQNGLRWKGP